MHPIAFHLAGYPVRFAGLLYVGAVIISWLYAYRVARRQGWDTEAVLPGVAIVVAAAYLGARLHAALSDRERFWSDPVRELVQSGNLSFFGGLALGSIAMVAYLTWARLPALKVADALAPIAPVVYALFRLGCFVNGDDYGRPTSLPWGVSFPDGAPPTFERVHPVQLYEMALMVPIWMAVRWRTRFDLPDGARAFELCVLMGMERFFVEFLRPQVDGTSYLGTPQWLALTLIAIGIAGRFRLRRGEIATK